LGSGGGGGTVPAIVTHYTRSATGMGQARCHQIGGGGKGSRRKGRERGLSHWGGGLDLVSPRGRGRLAPFLLKKPSRPSMGKGKRVKSEPNAGELQSRVASSSDWRVRALTCLGTIAGHRKEPLLMSMEFVRKKNGRPMAYEGGGVGKAPGGCSKKRRRNKTSKERKSLVKRVPAVEAGASTKPIKTGPMGLSSSNKVHRLGQELIQELAAVC